MVRSPSNSIWVWLVAAALLIPGMYLVMHGLYSILICTTFAACLLLAWKIDKSAAIILNFLYLLFLGDIRRIVSTIIGLQLLDPLVLLGSIFATCVAVPLLLRLRLTDTFSKVVLALTLIMTLEIVNPRQGGLATGLSGALFFLTPMFWFWIARTYATQRLTFLMIYRLLIPVGVLSAILGIYQTYIGFLPWQNAWIKASIATGYTALFLGGGHIRSFGFSSNSPEYGNLLMVSSACIVAAAFAGRRAYLLLLPVLFTAQLLASQRSPILKLLVAIVMLWAVRGRNPRFVLPRLLAGLPLGMALLYFAATHSGEPAAASKKADSANLATNHVTQGLAHPFDSRYSTAGLHSDLFFSGVMDGFINPLGDGLGIVTLGAGKFGGGDPAITGSSEIDISDVFITTGFMGGILYVFAIGLALRNALLYRQTGPPLLSYPIVGILTCMLGGWIPLGQYSLGPFLWFCLGFLAHQENEAKASREAAALAEAGPEAVPGEMVHAV